MIKWMYSNNDMFKNLSNVLILHQLILKLNQESHVAILSDGYSIITTLYCMECFYTLGISFLLMSSMLRSRRKQSQAHDFTDLEWVTGLM